MSSSKIVHADAIRRKPVPKDQVTPDRENAARWIEQLWGPETTLTDIADEAGYSRQHISNTLKLYFEPAEEDTERSESSESIRRAKNTNGVVELDMATLVRVFRMAYQLGREDERRLQRGEDLDLPDSDFAQLMGVESFK